MNIPFLKYYKVYFIFSGILILGSLVCLALFGLNFGIEFTGGSILEIEYKDRKPPTQEIHQTLAPFNLKESIQSTGERGVIIRMGDITEDTKEQLLEKLKEKEEIIEGKTSFELIGPMIGQELKQKTKVVVILALLAIVLYIALAFRRIQRPVKSWQYGIASLLALFHDVLIPIGILSLLGFLYGVQITIPVIVALLTVLGYSINDTVVVFDRIRENLLKRIGVTYQETVNQSLNQTLTRSVNTSLTTLFVLIAIFFLGGESLKYFALTLILGIVAGTYSSLFLASPILVSWLKWRRQQV